MFLCTYISFVSLLVCACKFFCIFSLKKNNKKVWSWWPHLPILLTWLLSTFLWKIYLYALIFICLNLRLFVIICENFFFLWESLPISDHNENLSLFKIIMRISPYLWPSWESLLIYDHLWESFVIKAWSRYFVNFVCPKFMNFSLNSSPYYILYHQISLMVYIFDFNPTNSLFIFSSDSAFILPIIASKCFLIKL